MVEKDKGQAGRLFRTAAGCRMGAVGEGIVRFRSSDTAVPGLSPGFSHQTCLAVYAPFTPSKSG